MGRYGGGDSIDKSNADQLEKGSLPSSLEWSLSVMKLKALVFLLSVRIGTPRYLTEIIAGSDVKLSFHIVDFIWQSVGGEKKSWTRSS